MAKVTKNDYTVTLDSKEWELINDYYMSTDPDESSAFASQMADLVERVDSQF